MVDRLADWLLNHCPFSTLTVLTMIVAGSSIPFPRPIVVLIPVILADVALNLFRHVRRTRREDRPSRLSSGVIA